MGKNIITISREFGSGGHTIGKMVAEQLGIEIYDKDVIRKTVEESGLHEKFVKAYGEYAPTADDRFVENQGKDYQRICQNRSLCDCGKLC